MDVAFARRARDLLLDAGHPVAYHESDAARHIDPAPLPAASERLSAATTDTLRGGR